MTTYPEPYGRASRDVITTAELCAENMPVVSYFRTDNVIICHFRTFSATSLAAFHGNVAHSSVSTFASHVDVLLGCVNTKHIRNNNNDIG